ncbi:Mov34/MPN/PAD-1 family protein [Paraburkholderia sp. BL17N1]|uniref:Mov34/MPN/PAD-1 family protein n=1 Tax=Paraburkholderia sp. BL17N1 TaxID=1938798 RepID=UPI000EAB9756|nr:Mov34/MPN/PAD-1 family protein [Paraburkholderia sp. BL17N1]RKR36212.1 JAB domain-containing protein similar to deubiquitination enzymes [Paraburkholderia sp. BL17N1]
MISVELSSRQIERFRRELRRAGNQEIGGVMVAEHLEDAAFRLAGFSVQRSGGSFASFVRKPALHRRFLSRFFQQTGQEFERFNYLGEWHSHPCFVARPSSQDIVQMQALVDDPDQAALFAVLLIVRLGRHNDLEVSAYAFRRGCSPVEAEIYCADELLSAPREPSFRVGKSRLQLGYRRRRR